MFIKVYAKEYDYQCLEMLFDIMLIIFNPSFINLLFLRPQDNQAVHVNLAMSRLVTQDFASGLTMVNGIHVHSY